MKTIGIFSIKGGGVFKNVLRTFLNTPSPLLYEKIHLLFHNVVYQVRAYGADLYAG
jgi:hypothetical protein